MTAPQALRLSIGPVQGFIAAGRRTRDFWAGSFLLSRLSGEAMAAVIAQGGTITIPVVGIAGSAVNEPTLTAIINAQSGSVTTIGPLVGTLPNHFRAEVSVGFEPKLVEDAVRAKFTQLGKAVCEHFFPDFDQTVKERWDFQTSGNFFEILWVMGDAVESDAGWADETRWLDQRKTMRDHPPLLETLAGLPGTGDRCPVHPDLCELGGFFRVDQRKQQNEFWEKLRKRVADKAYGQSPSCYIETLEIREGERLSAMALVKRLFPLLPASKLKEVIGWVPDHRFGFGGTSDPKEAGQALRNWPSTSYVSAVPWIVEVGRDYPVAALGYANAVWSAPIDEAERPQFHRMGSVDALRNGQGLPVFATLDGNLYFPRGLAKRLDDSVAAVRAFDALSAKVATAWNVSKENAKPSPFYALLDMDGDSMGRIFSKTKDIASKGSKALLEFAAGVQSIVRAHDGVLIYSGADDVNAMLPVETAIHCAMVIRILWTKVMTDAELGDTVPTLSGSIVFSDYQNHLGEIRVLAHSRLDTVAKEGMGRDALAIAVAKSGGVASEWASAWDGNGKCGSFDAVNALLKYAGAAAQEKTIASRLPYVVRDRFAGILADPIQFDHVKLAQLLTKELSDSGLSALGSSSQDKAQIIAEILQPWGRKNGAVTAAERHVGGLVIARFLVQNMLWPYFENWKKQMNGEAV